MNAPTPMRTLRLGNGLGHVELSWDSDADEKVRPEIERMMERGIRFFRVDTTSIINIPRRLRKIEDLKRQRINIADADLQGLIDDGTLQLQRLDDSEFKVLPGKPTVQEVVSGHTAAVRQFEGG